MFESLTERLQQVFRKLQARGRVDEAVLEATLREVRLALLEADVHVRVAKDLLERVREKALGEAVLRSLTPAQQVIRIVRDELAALLGAGEARELRFAPRPPTVFLLVGLQGSGKTTTAAKLGAWLRRRGRYPLLVPADLQRPAAEEQLRRVAAGAGLRVHERERAATALEVALEAVAAARRSGFDTLVVDTAGRLHVDAGLMGELRALRAALEPQEVLFVADAMTGQDAVRSAAEFQREVAVTGAVLTKLDGDARGGAALSIRHVTGVPILFAGVGERIEDLEPFHADRLVGRILGMGDVLTLIEKAEAALDREQARQLERKLRRDRFTLEDFRQQLQLVRRMGSLSSLVSLLPGMGAVREADLDPQALTAVMAILDSMTAEERANPRLLDGSRKRRIARGSGRSVQEINRLLKQFAQLQRVWKALPGRRGRGLPFGRR